jgi:hypothetical protein
MSVQASNTTACDPKNNIGPYHEVEIGYPSRVETCLLPYCEEPSEPLNSVYLYVPVRVLWEVITKHGGIVSGTLPPITITG